MLLFRRVGSCKELDEEARHGSIFRQGPNGMVPVRVLCFIRALLCTLHQRTQKNSQLEQVDYVEKASIMSLTNSSPYL